MPIKNLKLFLVESAPALEAWLSDPDFQLTRAENLAAALPQIQTQSYDLIVLAWALQEPSLVEVFKRIQAGCGSTPILVVMPASDEAAAILALEQGAQDYLLQTELTRQSLHSAIRKAVIRQSRLALHPQESYLLHALMDNIPDNIYFKDIHSRFLMINRAKAASHHLDDPMQAVGKSDADFCTPSVYEKTLADELFIMRTGNPIRAIEAYTTYADGRVICQSVTKMPLRNPFGEIIGTFGISRDITAQKEAAQALANEHAILRLLMENLPVCVFLKDCSGRITLANSYYLRNFGVTRECDLIGKTDFDFFPKEQAEIYFQAEQEVIKTGQPLLNREEKIPVPGGSTLWMLTSKVALQDAEGRTIGLAGIALDITERKQMEEIQSQLRQSQKMEAIGQLAGGVAHDFNNILAAIQLLAGMMRDDPALSGPHRNYVQEIEQAAERAANLTRQLLQFSRKQAMQHRKLNLTEVSTGICNLLQRTLGGDVQVFLRFSVQPLWIKADESMIEQVIMNLGVNARDAMPNGGQLTVETAAVEFDAATVPAIPDARPGAFACLTVTDTGSGILPDVLPKIFEPFFTTKDVGKGSGLGLAAVFGIVREHKGWIQVNTEVGRGTSFRIYFPQADYLSSPDRFSVEEQPVQVGKATILLVEDETLLRAALRDTLCKLGYRVIEAASGSEALEVWKVRRLEIQLLFTDLMMPGGLNGFQLAAELLKENPDLKVIYASGYSAEIASEDQLITFKEGVNFLSKPFDVQKLAQTLAACLNKK